MSDDTGENRDETEQPGNARDLVDELAGDYAKYFVIDTSKEVIYCYHLWQQLIVSAFNLRFHNLRKLLNKI